MTIPTVPERPFLSVVIPVRNAAGDLSRCLASIERARHTPGEVEIVVVDNGSSDDSRDVARRSGARVLDRPDLTVGACRNHGAAAAAGDVLAFIDADHEISPGWLQACRSALAAEDIGAVGYLCRPPDNPTWVQRTYDALRGKTSTRQDVEWLGAGNLAIRRVAFEEVGGFDERLEACEDVHLCRLLRQSGYRLLSDPGMESVHHGDPRTLAALFAGELWRGRDNLRVSFEPPITIRALPSALMPIVTLGSLVLLAAGLVVWRWTGALALMGAAGLVLTTTAKAVVIIARGRLSRPGAWLQGFVVAAVYEIARALSLVSGTKHSTRVRVARHA